MRIVSLLPNATEVVAALGAGDQLLGRSHECDHPEWVQQLPPCTRTKVVPEGTSHEIDQSVKNLVQQGLSVYEVDGAQLQNLQPDILITQMQCELCAASPDDVEKAVTEHLNYQPEITTLSPNNMKEVFQDFNRIAEALNIREKGEQLVQEVRDEMADIARKSGDISTKPRVAVVEWIDPLMFAGNWIPKLVEYAGGRNLFTFEGTHSPVHKFQDLFDADPDKLLVIPCGFDMNHTLHEMPQLTSKTGWDQLSAVQNGEVYLADGHQYFNRPGPRLVESLKIMAEICHPEQFDFGLKGEGYTPYYAK